MSHNDLVLSHSAMAGRERDNLCDMLRTASVSNWFDATQKKAITDWLHRLKVVPQREKGDDNS